MSRKLFSFCGALLLAGALALATSESAQAQHRGGGHSGGFHSGGFHSGGFHSGGFHSGGFHSGGSHAGGAHRGSFYGGYHHTYPHHGYWGNHHHYYHPYYGWYGGYPYYGLYGSYYDTYPYAGSSYSDYYSGQTPSYSDLPYAPTPPPVTYQPDNAAHITVSVPPGATIWFDDQTMTTTGSVREFQSPPLTPGSQYGYEVRARWYENGQEVTQTQQVPVAAGAHVRVVFPVEPANAITTPNR